MTASSDTRQLTLLPPDAAALLHLVRENLRLLAQLVTRYEVGRVEAPTDERIVRCPADVAAYLGAELSDLAQEQMRVVLLDSQNRIMATQLVYQGGLNTTAIRLADCFRDAVARGAAAVVFLHNHPRGARRRRPRTSVSRATRARWATCSASSCSTTSWSPARVT